MTSNPKVSNLAGKVTFPDGGPAFPCPDYPTGQPPFFGMSLRDYFAGCSLTGLLACGPSTGIARGETALVAYRIADEMLAQRNEGRSQSLDVPPLTPYQSSIKIP